MKYLAITAALALILAGASFAGNVTVTEVITGSNLTLTLPDNFSLSSITMGGSEILYGYSGGKLCYVEDSRGTGAGWNLGFAISQFITSGTPTRTLPSTAYSMFASEPDWIYGQYVDYANGHRSLILSYTLLQGEEVKHITAPSGYGMGKYNVNTFGKLTLSPAVYAGTYTATLTATLNAAP